MQLRMSLIEHDENEADEDGILCNLQRRWLHPNGVFPVFSAPCTALTANDIYTLDISTKVSETFSLSQVKKLIDR